MVDQRLKKSDGEGRHDRAMEDRAAVDELDEKTRFYLSNAEEGALDQTVLPNLPKMPGFVTCWCSATHPTDTIQGRMQRFGYTPILASELPGWEHTTLKDSFVPGCIQVREMVAMKVMKVVHDKMMQRTAVDLPNRHEASVRAGRESIERHNIAAGHAWMNDPDKF